jgi:hypothetical protein
MALKGNIISIIKPAETASIQIGFEVDLKREPGRGIIMSQTERHPIKVGFGGGS